MQLYMLILHNTLTILLHNSHSFIISRIIYMNEHSMMSKQQPPQGLQPRFSNAHGQTSGARQVILNGRAFSPSSSPVVLGKRKSNWQREEIKISNSKRKSNEGNVSVTRMPRHCQSVTENTGLLPMTCAENIGVTTQQTPDDTKPFVNVLEQFGRGHAPLLAQEIKQLNISRFPMESVAEKLASKMILDRKTIEINPDSAIDSSIDVAVIVRSLLRDLRESITNPNTEIMKKLEDFDRVSQSFGLNNAINHLDFLDQCISCLCTKLSKKNEKSQE